MDRMPLATAAAAFLYAGIAALLLFNGDRLPLQDPRIPAAVAPLNGPLGDLLNYALPALAVAGGFIALAVHALRRPGRALAISATAFAGVYTALVLLVIVDSRILSMLGYLPYLAVNAIMDPGVLASVPEQGWPVLLHQLAAVTGVGLWILTAAAAVRKHSGACITCGRKHDDGGWLSAASAGKWGTPVTLAAAAIPAVYAIIRFAWAAGIPLGISSAFLRRMQENGMVYAGLGLASMAFAGTLLTLGLIQGWGSVVPRWVPLLGGRRVPILLAVIPASFVAVVVVPAGAELIRLGLSGDTGGIPFDWTNWGTIAPAALWIFWGPLLGAAALAYYLKRRGTCGRCGLDG
ncbi:hypothetical protein SAMN04489742_1167 [Arthrobacter crystallopoietes]|uniref:Uncharacterized protein n=2 Tax=Crystallibacter crystallopoietes TaxID=37928 RepID=A0A1H1AZT7_9MICC|nr:hypothetical protein SAMN04489742_1167 [Arthrobacter crystallopoietes]